MDESTKTQAAFFDSQAENWDDIWTDELLSRIAKIMQEDIPLLHPPILDVGSGTGVMLPFLQKQSKSGLPIIELDISRRMLEVGQRKRHRTSNAIFIQGDAHTLPFAPHYFRTIFCFSVFPHFQDHNSILQEFYRCLTKDGRLVIMHVQGHEQLNAMHAKADAKVAEDILPPVQKMTENVQMHNFNISHA
ncbi:MAG: class I SAM-dependent methyltransferase, partial [Calditrichaeota bacterium]